MRSAYDVVKAHYDANDRRDIEGMLADITPTTEWTEMAGFPCAGTYTGRDAIVENVFMALGAQFDNYTFKLDRLLDAGDDVVAVGDYSATHKKTGKSFAARVVHIWQVKNGKLHRFEQFTDTLLVAQSMR
jgi:uncharacterized protein